MATKTYIYELPDAAGKLRYVEARSRDQAIAHVYRPQVRVTSRADLPLLRNPLTVIEVAGAQEIDSQPDLPRLPTTDPQIEE